MKFITLLLPRLLPARILVDVFNNNGDSYPELKVGEQDPAADLGAYLESTLGRCSLTKSLADVKKGLPAEDTAGLFAGGIIWGEDFVEGIDSHGDLW